MNIWGQNHTSQYTKDTAYISAQLKIIKPIVNSKPDSALELTEPLLELSKTINYKYGIYRTNNFIGIAHLNTNQFVKAHDHFQEALVFTKDLDNPKYRGMILGNIALTFRYRYIKDSALYYFKKAKAHTQEHSLKYLYSKTLFDIATLQLDSEKYTEASKNLFEAKKGAEELNDSLLLVYIYNIYGVLYTKVQKFDQALLYFKTLKKIDDQFEKTNLLASTYINIGELYFQLKDDYDSALYYYKLSKNAARPHERPSYYLANNINIGNVFYATKQFDSAIIYYEKELNNPYLEYFPKKKAAIYVNLGIVNLHFKNYKAAEKHLLTGYQICDDNEILNFKLNATRGLYQLDSIRGNIEKSFEYFKEYHKISKNIMTNIAENKTASLEFEQEMATQKFNNKFLLSQNENKSKQIATQKKLILVSAIGSVIMLIFIFFLFKNRRKIKILHKDISISNDYLLTMNSKLQKSNSTLVEQQLQLEKINITKDKFFTILGHDLKSPFVSLLGMLDLLVEDWAEMEDQDKQDHIKRLLQSSQNNYKLLEDLLNWGKLQQGHIICQNEIFNASEVIDEITELFADQIKNKKLHVNNAIDPEIILNTDRHLFTQIIQNLTNNAIKFTHINGKITLKLINKNDELHICVSDTGIGIPADKVETIFNLDSDFNRQGTQMENSTGMGLIISREFAGVINASLSLKSEVNVGSTFCLALKKNQ